MKNMKKVEFIIESVYLTRLLDLFKKHHIEGYTIIKDLEGAGGHGLRTGDDVSGVFSNIYVFTVCEEYEYQEMDADIRIFIDKYGGKCMLIDVSVLLSHSKK